MSANIQSNIAMAYMQLINVLYKIGIYIIIIIIFIYK